jgi:hypothetical protein
MITWVLSCFLSVNGTWSSSEKHSFIKSGAISWLNECQRLACVLLEIGRCSMQVKI